jgi:Cytochrome oxidase complex assembly protein 1
MTSTPVSAASGIPAPQRRKSWLNNWKIVVPVILGALLLLLGLFVFGILSFVYSMFHNSEPYAVAIRCANQSAAVALEIGSPVHVGWLMSGNINYNNADGSADLSIPISGAKGRGRIIVVGKKHAGHWTYETLEVDVEGQSVPIELTNPAPAPASPPAEPENQPSPAHSPGSV